MCSSVQLSPPNLALPIPSTRFRPPLQEVHITLIVSFIKAPLSDNIFTAFE